MQLNEYVANLLEAARLAGGPKTYLTTVPTAFQATWRFVALLEEESAKAPMYDSDLKENGGVQTPHISKKQAEGIMYVFR
jgi:hypothetical protein